MMASSLFAGAGDHVAGVLLVARRVGDDELALVRGEVAVGHVDGDALLALGSQPVQQQGKVDPLVAPLLTGLLDGGVLVLEDAVGLVEQAPDEGGFAVVHASRGGEAQEALLFVILHIH
jgi:hypothetical protein